MFKVNIYREIAHSLAYRLQPHVQGKYREIVHSLAYRLQPHVQGKYREIAHSLAYRLQPHVQGTPQPLYNTVSYNMVLHITLISVGPQMVIFDLFSYITIHFTLVITGFG